MMGYWLYMIVLFAINVLILKLVISWLVEKINWVKALIIAVILTGAGAVVGMVLSPLMLI